jgi:hydrogenase nickel incorporation protein HypA/HybF
VHELSIALSIIDIATSESIRHGAQSVSAIHVKLGELSGVVQEALEYSYSLAVEDTELREAKLVIEKIGVRVECPVCGGVRPVKSPQCLCCEVCGTPASAVVQGQELLVSALEIRS